MNSNWIYLAFLTATFYGVYNVFIKVASTNINQIAGAVILQIVASIAGVILLLVQKFWGITINMTNKGILYAVLAGVFVGLAEITSFYVFSKGVSASVGIPIIIGGSVAVATLVGFVFLKETMSIKQFLGILMIVTGIVLLTYK